MGERMAWMGERAWKGERGQTGERGWMGERRRWEIILCCKKDAPISGILITNGGIIIIHDAVVFHSGYR